MAENKREEWDPIPYADQVVKALSDCNLTVAMSALRIAQERLTCADYAKPRPNFFNALNTVSGGEENG